MSDESAKLVMLAKLQLYRRAVRRPLLQEWDPIGIKDEPQVQDEYDTYVDQICSLLIRRADLAEKSEYLWRTESEIMGMPGTRRVSDEIASRLLEIREEIEGSA